MAPIDPAHLLKALDSLLSPEGGIRSNEEVIRLASLMRKFSKKLVSRCVYCNVLQATSEDILSEFLDKGGWETIFMWLQDAKSCTSPSFLLEMLKLCACLPMTLNRLKENNTAKIIKSLTKHENSDVKSLSSNIVDKWMNIIKGEKGKDISSDKKRKKIKISKTPIVKQEKIEEKPSNFSPKIPNKIKGNKRTSSEKEIKTEEIYEDVKIDPEPLEPIVKKSRTDRPKTAKLYQKKFRTTGLEEETVLPKNISKKTTTVDKNVAAVVAKNALVKMNSTLSNRINEKKIKPESLINVDETSPNTKGIKLINAKPRPAHILHESASFMDALTSQPIAPIKRKKKVQPNKIVTSPTSPTITPPKFQFYKDTLEYNEEDETKKDNSPNDDGIDEKQFSPSEKNENEKMDISSENETLSNGNNDESFNKSIDDQLFEGTENRMSPHRSFPNQLRSILSYGRRKGKKKSVKWVEDNKLKDIFYFEMDETERVNVLRTQNFGDLKSIEVKREREAFELAKRQAGDKMEEAIPWWFEPILIEVPNPLIEVGCQSTQKLEQKERQQGILQEIYFTREMIPDSPHEPDLEIIAPQEPKIIPLDENNSIGPVIDYSSYEVPMKSALPEVLTSLINVHTNKNISSNIPQEQQVGIVSNNINSSLINSNAINQPTPISMTSPYDPGDPVSMPPVSSTRSLLGVAPPMPNMFMPAVSENENVNPQGDWRPNDMIQQEQMYLGGYPMNPGVVPQNPVPGMNMRPRMMQDMFRPNIHKGPRGMGGSRPRGLPRVPCRHFLAGGCRFGINCSFLHPGINGPAL